MVYVQCSLPHEHISVRWLYTQRPATKTSLFCCLAFYALFQRAVYWTYWSCVSAVGIAAPTECTIILCVCPYYTYRIHASRYVLIRDVTGSSKSLCCDISKSDFPQNTLNNHILQTKKKKKREASENPDFITCIFFWYLMSWNFIWI